MQDPGLDLHERTTLWQELEDQLHESPYDALPQVTDLVESMLGARGYANGKPATLEGQDLEIVAQYRYAREISDKLESGADVDPGDVGAAVEGLRALFEHVTATRTA